MWYVY